MKSKIITFNKKAISPLAVILIIALIIIVLGVIAFLILNQKGYFNNDSPQTNQSMIKLILTAGDTDVQNSSVNANYRIRSANGIFITEGTLESGEKREIIIFPETLEIACWSNDYYLVKAYKIFSGIEVNYKVATFSCDMRKIEKNLNIEYSGNFDGRNLVHYLNLTAKDYFQKPIICVGYTSGFNKVYMEQFMLTCDSGVWANYTFYNATTRTYDYLPKDEYICGKDRIEKCEVVLGTKCKPPTQDIPLKYSSYADDCYYFGEDINKRTLSIPVTIIVGDYVSRFDEIKFFVIDQDRRWSPEENRYSWFSEYNGEDLGTLDINLTVNYFEN